MTPVNEASSMVRRDAPSSSVVRWIRPLEDPRWDSFVTTHARSSVFHSLAWIQALHKTYGYEPLVLTTAEPGAPLKTGILFCAVDSWLTGSRLVSVPFADHCDVLVDDPADMRTMMSFLAREMATCRQDYVEIRSSLALQSTPHPCSVGRSYCHHRLDLGPEVEALFLGCHRSCTQRKIQRARRERLVYREGRTEELLTVFYQMLVRARRHRGIPPQPKVWFKNLVDCFGRALKIRVAFLEDLPVAAIVTLRHKNELVFKYGCSDPKLNRLGGTHLLLWRAIQEAKGEGLDTFDFGRSDLADKGLIAFKNRWGASASQLTYTRLLASPLHRTKVDALDSEWRKQLTAPIISRIPTPILRALGGMLYRHMG